MRSRPPDSISLWHNAAANNTARDVQVDSEMPNWLQKPVCSRLHQPWTGSSGLLTRYRITVVAGTNMLSSWHDSILSKAAAQKWSASERPKPSSHARYTAAWRDASGIYSACAKALTLIHYTELLLEMVALKKTGKKGKWRAVVLIELAKCVLFNAHPVSLRYRGSKLGSDSSANCHTELCFVWRCSRTLSPDR